MGFNPEWENNTELVAKTKKEIKMKKAKPKTVKKAAPKAKVKKTQPKTKVFYCAYIPSEGDSVLTTLEEGRWESDINKVKKDMKEDADEGGLSSF